MKLTEIVDKRALEKILESFARATEINSSIKNSNLNLLVGPINRQEICSLIRKNRSGEMKCNRCDKSLIKQCYKKRDKIIKPCHIGIIDFASPIMIENKVIACILGGQIIPTSWNYEEYRESLHNLSIELGIHEYELLNMLERLPRKSDSEIVSIASLMQEVANTISQVAYEKYQLSKAEHDNKARLKILLKVSHTMLRYNNLDLLLRYSSNIAQKNLRSEVSSIFIFEGTKLKRRAISGVDSSWFPDECYGIGLGATGSVVKSVGDKTFGEPIMDNDFANSVYNIKENTLRFEQALRSKVVRHILCIPLNGDNRTFGVLRIINKLNKQGSLDEKGFTNDDKDLLSTIASQVATAVANIRKRDKLKTIFDLNDLIAANGSERLVRQKIVDILTNSIWKYKACLLQQFEPKLQVLLVSNIGGSVNKHQGKRFSVVKSGEGITGRVMESGKSQYIKNIQFDKHSEFKEWAKINRLVSMFCVPIKRRRNNIGTLSIFTDYEYIFYPDERNFLKAFAYKAGLIIENSRLLKKNEKRINELKAIDIIARELNSELKLDSLLNTALTKLLEVCLADRACIKLVEASNKLILKAGLNCPFMEKNQECRMQPCNDITTNVIHNNRAEIVNDIKSEIDNWIHCKNADMMQKMRSQLAVPINDEGKVIGVINLESAQPYFFGVEELAIINALSNHIAIALKNANRLKKIEEIATTYPTITELDTDINNVLRKIAAVAQRVLDADIVVIYRFEQATKNNIFPPVYAGKLFEPKYMDRKISSYEAPCRIIDNGKNHYAVDTQADPLMTPERSARKGIPERFTRREKIASSAGLLLKVGKDSVGIMFINYRSHHAFNNEERRIIESYASYIALAIQNIIHFQEKEREQRERRHNDLLIGIENVAAITAHSARNRLTPIRLNAEFLSQKITDDSLKDCVDTIIRNTAKLEEQITSLLDITKPISLKIERINFKKVFARLFSEMQTMSENKGIEFYAKILRNLKTIYLDRTRIEDVFWNLFHNSLDATPSGGKIQITFKRSKNKLIIYWQDTGQGVPSEFSEKIFDFQFSTKGTYGIGLSSCKKIIKEHNGEIFLDKKYKNGLRIVIHLPLVAISASKN